jgi:sialate O-acetylesterase
LFTTYIPAFYSLFLLCKYSIACCSCKQHGFTTTKQSKTLGWAAPAEMVYITTSWNNKTDSVKATRDANWQLFVQTPPAGGPYTITFKGQNTITLENVMIGEVWICSGQSNMEMNEQWGLPDVKAELPTCANKNIRFFYIPKTTSATPQDDCKTSWTLCDSVHSRLLVLLVISLERN